MSSVIIHWYGETCKEILTPIIKRSVWARVGSQDQKRFLNKTNILKKMAKNHLSQSASSDDEKHHQWRDLLCWILHGTACYTASGYVVVVKTKIVAMISGWMSCMMTAVETQYDGHDMMVMMKRDLKSSRSVSECCAGIPSLRRSYHGASHPLLLHPPW